MALRLVLVLAALVLAGHHDPGGEVGQANGRVGLVDVLPAGARRAVGVDAEILLVDVHLVGHVLEEGDDVERGEAGLASVLRVERRDAHERCTPRSAESSPNAKRPFTMKVADSSPASWPGVASSTSISKPRRSAQRVVHAQHHLAQSCASVPPGSGVDLGHGVVVVVGAGEQRAELEHPEAAVEVFDDPLPPRAAASRPPLPRSAR
jgi:hypothetical protein